MVQQTNGVMFVRGASVSSVSSSMPSRTLTNSSNNSYNNNARHSLASATPCLSINSIPHRASSYIPQRSESIGYQMSIKDILAKLNEQKATSQQQYKFPKRSPSIMSSTSSSSSKSKKTTNTNLKIDKPAASTSQSTLYYPQRNSIKSLRIIREKSQVKSNEKMSEKANESIDDQSFYTDYSHQLQLSRPKSHIDRGQVRKGSSSTILKHQIDYVPIRHSFDMKINEQQQQQRPVSSKSTLMRANSLIAQSLSSNQQVPSALSTLNPNYNANMFRSYLKSAKSSTISESYAESLSSINKPQKQCRIASTLSYDAQLATLRAYEDLINEELKIVNPALVVDDMHPYYSSGGSQCSRSSTSVSNQSNYSNTETASNQRKSSIFGSMPNRNENDREHNESRKLHVMQLIEMAMKILDSIKALRKHNKFSNADRDDLSSTNEYYLIPTKSQRPYQQSMSTITATTSCTLNFDDEDPFEMYTRWVDLLGKLNLDS